tara:strand:+ start:553 stop:705 length:153 start_codon:yes stop_codon:yes gene_type:complete
VSEALGILLGAGLLSPLTSGADVRSAVSLKSATMLGNTLRLHRWMLAPVQ